MMTCTEPLLRRRLTGGAAAAAGAAAGTGASPGCEEAQPMRVCVGGPIQWKASVLAYTHFNLRNDTYM